MDLQNLKAELKEKEKGCGKRFKISGDLYGVCDTEFYGLCSVCQAKVEYIKKGIEACEEILNSQATKTFYTEQDKSRTSVVQKPVSEDDGVTEPFFEGQKLDTNTLMKEMSHYKSKCMDLICENNELKKALEQRNKEFLERLQELEYAEYSNTDKRIDFIEELKQQLTKEDHAHHTNCPLKEKKDDRT